MNSIENYQILENYDDILTADDVKAILKIGKNTCYDLLKSGILKSIKIGNSYRIPKSELVNYLQNNL